MTVVDFSFDPNTRYTFWSGITGGLFLALSYFGTRPVPGAALPRRQVGQPQPAGPALQRHLLKIPMQALILFIGILVFAFYLFDKPPVFFNEHVLDQVRQTEHSAELTAIEDRWDAAFETRKASAQALVDADTPAHREALVTAQAELDVVRAEAKELIGEAVPGRRARGQRLHLRLLRAEVPASRPGGPAAGRDSSPPR